MYISENIKNHDNQYGFTAMINTDRKNSFKGCVDSLEMYNISNGKDNEAKVKLYRYHLPELLSKGKRSFVFGMSQIEAV